MDLPFPAFSLCAAHIQQHCSVIAAVIAVAVVKISGGLKWKTQVCTEELPTFAHPQVQGQSGLSLKSSFRAFHQRQLRHFLPVQLLPRAPRSFALCPNSGHVLITGKRLLIAHIPVIKTLSLKCCL